MSDRPFVCPHWYDQLNFVFTFVDDICCIANPTIAGYSDNAQRLRSLGFEARLKEMREDPVVNVRERVADALEGCFDPDPAAHSMIVD